jgi:hypothetical protein
MQYSLHSKSINQWQEYMHDKWNFFFLGSRWMRTPSIIYGTAIVSLAIPMVAHILFEDFKGLKVGPSTQEQRYVLAGFYGMFAVTGLFIVLDNVFLRAPPTSAGFQGRIGEANKQKKRN